MDENKNIEAMNSEVELENVDIIDIEMDSAFPYVSSDDEQSSLLNHSLLYGTELPNQHPIEAITGLESELNNLKAVKQVYSTQNGLSEFRKWSDDNPNGEDRSGYFVTMSDDGSETVEKCGATHDVYGVSITRSHIGFIGNQNEYDKSDDFSYALVGIVGAMRVRTDGSARVGDYVVPNAFGEAKLSDNNYGYKVLSEGNYSSYSYVTIALVPQSDALSRIGGDGSVSDLSEIIIQINNIGDKADEAINKSQIAIDTSNMSQEEINGIRQEITTLGTRVTGTEEAIADVTDIANEASQKAEDAVESANEMKQEAIDAANGAINEAKNAAELANDLRTQMEPLVSWHGDSDDEYGIAGFVAQANQDHTTLASIVSGSGDNGVDLSAIIQRIDENGAIIQHLVSHVDRYSVGSHSISDGLTYEEAQSILADEHIYVCTYGHTETMKGAPVEEIEFTREDGITYSYIWNPTTMTWTRGAEVRTNPIYEPGNAVGDLWLCFEDVERRDENDMVVETYIAGTLYRWFGSNWVAVATIDGSDEGRVLSSVTQTANDIKMTVTNFGDEGSTFQQNLESIFTTVQNSDNYISAIEQTADSIRAGTYSPDGTESSLELLAADTTAGLSAVASGRFHISYQSLLGTPPEVHEGGHKYSRPPEWNDELGIFVFDDSFIDDENGIYYFYNNNPTRYCVITKNGYDIYTIGNKATSLLDSRISETEAILTGEVEYATDNSKALAGIVAMADANSAKIDSVTSYYCHTLLLVSETEIPVYSPYKHNKPPEWDLAKGEYVFETSSRDNDGIYYLADSQGSTYCKVVTTGDGQTLYEIYGLAGSYMASISQGADENGGYIQSIVLDIERYNVGKYSQSYGMSYDDAVSVIPEGTTYVPTVAHSENLIRDELGNVDDGIDILNAGTLEDRETDNDIVMLNTPPLEALEVTEMQTYDFEVEPTYTYRYTWSGTGWEKGAKVSTSTEYFEYDGTENTTDLWYCTKDVLNPGEAVAEGHDGIYRAGTLYAWKGGRWFAIATTNDSLLSRSIGLVRQTAESYSIQLRNLQGDFSTYEQTLDHISQTVGGYDGSIAELTVAKDRISGEVYNYTGSTATLKAQADSTQAVMDLMISGVYHKLEQPLADNVPEPYGNGAKYSTRPEWVASLGRFVFYEDYASENGVYYFFDDNQKHYCKVVGEQYEVYTIGTLAHAGTDAHITDEFSAINTLAYYGDEETSTIAGLRNLALESKAQVELLASLDTNKLNSVVTIVGYKPDGVRYSEKPIYKNGTFVFDAAKQDNNGLYFSIGGGSQYGKLIYSNSGICMGYEVYDYDNSNRSELVATVLDNKATMSLLVTDGEADGSLIIDAINGESSATINADRINFQGIVTAESLGSGGTTEIDGSRITTGNIESRNYQYEEGYFSLAGTQFDLYSGAVTSENFAIDTDGNLHLKGDITAQDARLRGNLSVGYNAEASDEAGYDVYNFVVDEDGNVSVAGTLDAKVLKFNGKSVLTSEDKVKADYLDLRGIIVRDSSGKITFSVDSYGNVTIEGDVTMGDITSISWSAITDVPSTVTNAYSRADSAYNLASSAQTDADTALESANTALTRANTANNTVSSWKYGSSTYIDGAMIASDTIMASKLIGGTVQLLTSSEDEAGYIKISNASTASYALDFYSDAAMRITANQGVLFLQAGTYNGIENNPPFVKIQGDEYRVYTNGSLMPASDNKDSCGFSNLRWTNIYATTSTIQTSDAREKKDIEYNPDKYESFFFDLKPTQYKFIDNTSDRYHIGFVSQDIEQALANNNLTSLDFAGFIKSPLYAEDGTTIKDYSYGLRYGEFIALNTHMIQKLYKRIEELETKIEELEK